MVRGDNDDISVDVTQNRDSRQRCSRVREQTELYGNPISSSIRGIMHMEEESDPTVVTPEERVTQRDLISRARGKEIDGWRNFDVFTEIKKEDIPTGVRVINSRFIESWKIVIDGSGKMKSRLVVMGNQDPDQSVISTFAPTAFREITIMALTRIIRNGWAIQSMDVEKAFLQATKRKSGRFKCGLEVEESRLWARRCSERTA